MNLTLAVCIYSSIAVSLTFAVIGDYFACKKARLKGYVPGDVEHAGLCITLLFSWNIGIMFFWVWPIYAYVRYIETRRTK